MAEGLTRGKGTVMAAAVVHREPLVLVLQEEAWGWHRPSLRGTLSRGFWGLGRTGMETGRMKRPPAPTAHFPRRSSSPRPKCHPNGGRKLTRGHLRSCFSWPKPCHLSLSSPPFPQETSASLCQKERDSGFPLIISLFRKQFCMYSMCWALSRLLGASPELGGTRDPVAPKD